MKEWTFKRHLGLSFLVLAVSVLAGILADYINVLLVMTSLMTSSGAAHVGVISGADGPTAIYATFDFTHFELMVHYSVLFVVMLALYPVFRKLIEGDHHA